MINVVLFRPEKPSNVGNIMRTVSATDSFLIIIGPLTFEFNDKSLKRAGMDYLENLNYKYYDSLDEFLKDYDPNKIFPLSSVTPTIMPPITRRRTLSKSKSAGLKETPG